MSKSDKIIIVIGAMVGIFISLTDVGKVLQPFIHYMGTAGVYVGLSISISVHVIIFSVLGYIASKFSNTLYSKLLILVRKRRGSKLENIEFKIPKNYILIKNFVLHNFEIDYILIGKSGAWIINEVDEDLVRQEKKSIYENKKHSKLTFDHVMPLVQACQELYNLLAEKIGIHCTMHGALIYKSSEDVLGKDNKISGIDITPFYKVKKVVENNDDPTNLDEESVEEIRKVLMSKLVVVLTY